MCIGIRYIVITFISDWEVSLKRLKKKNVIPIIIINTYAYIYIYIEM